MFKLRYNFFYIIIFYLVIYIFLFFNALNLNFIEGDDAVTVLYHVLGRNPNFQPYYSAYHSMFDKLLEFFSLTNESNLRYLSIGISFIFGFLNLILLAIFFRQRYKNNLSSIFLILIPFLIPDILFNSLIINPTMLSFAFIIISHILLFRYLENNINYFLFLSVIFFGFGVSFRWNNGFYLFVLLGDFILRQKFQFRNFLFFKSIKTVILISLLYIFSILIFIQISGFNIVDIVAIFNFAVSAFENTERSFFSMVSTSIAFFSPAFVVLLIVGIKKKLSFIDLKLLIWLIIALVPYFVVGFHPNFKYLINLVPILLLISYEGFIILKSNKYRIGILALILFPWMFGIQINNSTSWGPGFNINQKIIESTNKYEYNPDKRIIIEDIDLRLDSGTALPMPEGPRPIYGFFHVFSNDWYNFLDAINNERESAVSYALINKCNILQDVNHSLAISKLIEFGFDTKQKFYNKNNNKFEREFTKNNDSIKIIVFDSKFHLFDTNQIKELMLLEKEIVVYSSYTSIITKLAFDYNKNFKRMGGYWGILTFKS